MADNTNNTNKMPRWFPILLAVLALLTLKLRNDNAGGNGGSSNTNTGAQQNKNTVLSAVPAELRNNYFLDKKEMGCCKTLSGNVAVTVVMISDSVSQWDEESTTNLKTALETGGQDIVAEAATHTTELSLSFHYYNATMTGDICSGENTNDWQDTALKSAGLIPLDNLHNYLTKKYSSKEAPVVFAFNKPGRAFAGGGGLNEYVVLYAQKDWSAFQHELSHVFGAKDFYYPKEVKTLATAAFPDSIMCSGEMVDPLTAYLIGWADTVPDTALQFLKDTNELSAEYMDEERKEEQYTGYGTKEFESGTYTGALVRGQCHGQGSMRYDNGGWYIGQWSYGSWAGSGTGKWIYKDGSIYEGGYLNGNRHGQGTYTWSNGGWYTGQWSDGEQTGTGRGKKIYDNGVYEGELLNGNRHGQGTYTWSNGGWITGSWSNGEQTGAGRGKKIYDNGVYEGDFFNGKRHGQGTYTYTNGKVLSGTWNNGDFVG